MFQAFFVPVFLSLFGLTMIGAGLAAGLITKEPRATRVAVLGLALLAVGFLVARDQLGRLTF